MTNFKESVANDIACVVFDMVERNFIRTGEWCEGCCVRQCPEDYADEHCARYDDYNRVWDLCESLASKVVECATWKK